MDIKLIDIDVNLVKLFKFRQLARFLDWNL